MSRLRQIVANTGTFGAVRSGVVLLAVLVMVGIALAHGRLDIAAGGVIGLVAPWFARDWMVRDPNRTGKLLGVWAFVVAGGAVALSALRSQVTWVDPLLSGPAAGGFAFLLAAYISAFVLFTSDPRIEFVRRS